MWSSWVMLSLTVQTCYCAGKVSWSGDGRYLVTRNDNMPTVAWIWDVQKLDLCSVSQQLDGIKDVAWHPTSPRLVTCTGSTRMYLWSPDGASCVHIPLQNFHANAASWNTDGSALLLADRNAFCCAYIS